MHINDRFKLYFKTIINKHQMLIVDMLLLK